MVLHAPRFAGGRLRVSGSGSRARQPFPSGVTLAHNVATKDAVDATLAEAEAAGARIVKPAEEVFWGGYSGYFADPDGHLWEVAYPPLTGDAGED